MDTTEHGRQHQPGGGDSEYESEYTVPALQRQDQRIESGLMSIDDIPESMPVLRAFHEFLDQERLRSRRRIIVLSSVFIGTLIMVGIVAALLIANFHVSQGYRYKALEHELLQARDDVMKAKAAADLSVGRLADRTDGLKDMLLAGQQQMLAMQNRAASTAETQQREVTSLRQQLDALRTERRDTRSGELLALTDRYATLAAELDRTRREMAALQVRAAEPPVEPPRRPAYVPPLEAAPERALPPDTTVVLSIVPYGRDQAIQWRLPVPEE
jgi:hypothetical protein